MAVWMVVLQEGGVRAVNRARHEDEEERERRPRETKRDKERIRGEEEGRPKVICRGQEERERGGKNGTRNLTKTR